MSSNHVRSLLLLSLVLSFAQLMPGLSIFPHLSIVGASTTSNAVWGTPVALPINSPLQNQNPSMIKLQNGNLAVAWAYPTGGVYDLYLATKTSSGWATPVAVDEGGLCSSCGIPSNNEYPSLVELSDHTVMVFWAACLTSGISCSILYNDYNFARGSWSGLNDLTSINPTSYTFFDNAPSVVLTTNGQLCVFWHSDRGDPAFDDIYYACSKDNGTTWTPDPVSPGPARMPFSVTGVEDDFPSALSSNKGGLLLSWTSYRNLNSTAHNGNLFFTSWNGTYNPSNPSAGWGSQMQLTTDPHDSSKPTLAATNDGGIWLVFQSDRDSTSTTVFVDLYFKRSYSPMDPASWSTDRRLTLDTYDNSEPSAAQVQPGTIGVVWKSNQPPAATYDIFYDTLTFQNLQLVTLNTTPSVAPRGNVSISWNVANQGNSTQNVSLNLYWNTTHSINSTPFTRSSLAPGQNWASNYSWNTSGLTQGIYNILAVATCGCTNEENLSDNSLSSTTVVAVRDVGIQSITIPAFIYRGQTINVNVTVINEGRVVSETFNVMLYYNSTTKTIGTTTVTSLPPQTSRTVSIPWNTTLVKPGGCMMSGYIPPLPTETHLSDNNFTASHLYANCVRKTGDVTGDGVVDINDLIGVWQHQFTFTQQYDVDPPPYQDGYCDVHDLVTTYLGQFK